MMMQMQQQQQWMQMQMQQQGQAAGAGTEQGGEDSVYFEYRGKDGNVHGPYGASQMRGWAQQASTLVLYFESIPALLPSPYDSSAICWEIVWWCLDCAVGTVVFIGCCDYPPPYASRAGP